LDAVRLSSDHLVVHATAGAGKTTLLTQVAAQLPADKRQLYLAFACNAAQELKARLPAAVACRTVHSLGREVISLWLRSRGADDLQVEPQKYRRIARQIVRSRCPELRGEEVAAYLT